MYEEEFRKDFIPNRNLAYGTLVSLVIETLRVINDPHADISLKNRQISVLNQVRQLLIESDKR